MDTTLSTYCRWHSGKFVNLDTPNSQNVSRSMDRSYSIMSEATDFLILENRNHWLLWRKDDRGLWWDLNSLSEPVYYTDVEAAELRHRTVQLFECTRTRKAVV